MNRIETRLQGKKWYTKKVYKLWPPDLITNRTSTDLKGKTHLVEFLKIVALNVYL